MRSRTGTQAAVDAKTAIMPSTNKKSESPSVANGVLIAGDAAGGRGEEMNNNNPPQWGSSSGVAVISHQQSLIGSAAYSMFSQFMHSPVHLPRPSQIPAVQVPFQGYATPPPPPPSYSTSTEQSYSANSTNLRNGLSIFRNQITSMMQSSGTETLAEFLDFSQTAALVLRKELTACDGSVRESIVNWIMVELKGSLSVLLASKYGNFGVVAVFEAANASQRKTMLNEIKSSLVPVACTYHGCHALQNLISVVETEDHARIIVSSLAQRSLFLATDPNGVYVLRSCLGQTSPSSWTKNLNSIFHQFALDVILSAVFPNCEKPGIGKGAPSKSSYTSKSALFPLAIDTNGSMFLSSGLSMFRGDEAELHRIIVAEILSENIAYQLARHGVGFKLLMSLLSHSNAKLYASPLVDALLDSCENIVCDPFGSKVVMAMSEHFGQTAVDRVIPNLSSFVSILVRKDAYVYLRHVLSVASRFSINTTKLEDIIKDAQANSGIDRDIFKGSLHCRTRIDALLALLQE